MVIILHTFLDVNSGRDDKKYKNGTSIEVRIAYHNLCAYTCSSISFHLHVPTKKKCIIVFWNCGMKFIVLSLKLTKLFLYYRIAGNFRGSKLSRIRPKIIFTELIFANFIILPFCTVLFIIFANFIFANLKKSRK